MFKLIVLLSIFAFPGILGISEEMQELMTMLRNTCVGETGADQSLIEQINRDKVFADDEKLKCYIKCVLDQMAVIDDNGIIDVEGVIALVPEETQARAAVAIRSCGTKIGANPCENSWLTHKCWAEQEPSVYMLP